MAAFQTVSSPLSSVFGGGGGFFGGEEEQDEKDLRARADTTRKGRNSLDITNNGLDTERFSLDSSRPASGVEASAEAGVNAAKGTGGIGYGQLPDGAMVLVTVYAAEAIADPRPAAARAEGGGSSRKNGGRASTVELVGEMVEGAIKVRGEETREIFMWSEFPILDWPFPDVCS
jgi:hypothetical protein